MSGPSIEKLLLDLKAEDIRLWVDGERLRVSTPKGAFPARLREELGARRDEIIAFLRDAATGGTAVPALVPVAREQDLPLSFNQEGMWFLHQLDPENVAYNLQTRLLVATTVEALECAWNALLERHEVLRTRYAAAADGPRQRIDPPAPVTIPVADLTAFAGDLRAELERAAHHALKRPFDLLNGPVCNVEAYRLPGGEIAVFLSIHHIATDGWSLAQLNRELRELCAAFVQGREPRLPPLPIQYADYALWQRQWLSAEMLERLLAYWRTRLAGMPAALELPADFPRLASPSSSGSAHLVALPEALCSSIRALGQHCHATFFMTLLALFKILLARYAGEADVVVGTPIAERSRPGLEHVQGLCLNSLVLRTDLSGDPSFVEVLGRVRETVLGAFAHQELPFEKLVQALQPKRDLSRNPLFQVMFGMLFAQPRTSAVDDLDLERGSEPWSEMDAQVQFDLALNVHEGAQGVGLLFSFNTDLFRTATIERMAGHYLLLAEAVVADPQQRISELPLLSRAERHQLLVQWNDTAAEYPRHRCLHQLFEEQAVRTPTAVAVVSGRQQLTYAELDSRANQVAHHLISLGVGPDVLVGIGLERSCELIVGLLGILKAGGAYVPLDPGYPPRRLAFMLHDTRAPVLITERRLLAELPPYDGHIVCLDRDRETIAARPSTVAPCRATAENLAYVIYTSGSTGEPKGVMMGHRALVNHMEWMRRAFRFDSDDSVLQKTPISFDAAVWEFFMPLLVGGRLVMAPPDAHRDPVEIIAALREHRITTVQLVPSLFHLLTRRSDLTDCPALRRMFCGGEVLPRSAARRFFDLSAASLYNLYGPTEACIDATSWKCGRDDDGPTVPIGRPVANAAVYILDRHSRPVPVGVAGELFVAGDGLARGYLNRPGLTAEKFVPDPFSASPGARMYRTGDRARYHADGSIEFLGRVDDQVKVHGVRIEPGEIEAVLEAHALVRRAAVLAREDAQGDRRLVAYVVFADASAADAEPLRAHLHERLPAFMVPSAFVFLDALPLTPNGKIDRQALPAPRPDRQGGESHVLPRTEYERILAGVWGQVLKVDRVGVHDNFFDIGGHSLLAIESIVRFREITGRSLDPRLFYQQTLGQLAASVDDAAAPAGKPAPDAPAIRLEPFFFGADGRRLYGLLRVAREPREIGIVLCQPHAHEYIRCHRTFRELGQRLALAGFPVLSFDYFGTGDSGGEYEDGTLSGWTENTALAVDTVKRRTGVARVCLAGLRLGATLAVMAGAGRHDVAGLALWDPIVAGTDVEGELGRIRQFQQMDPLRQRDLAFPDVLGYRLTAGMMDELRRLDLCALPSLGPSALLVLETQREGSGRRFADHARTVGTPAEFRLSDDPRIWLREPFEAIVPGQSVEALVSWISGLER